MTTKIFQTLNFRFQFRLEFEILNSEILKIIQNVEIELNIDRNKKHFEKMLKLKIDILPALFALVRVRQSKDSIPVEDRFVEGVVLAHLTIGFVNH